MASPHSAFKQMTLTSIELLTVETWVDETLALNVLHKRIMGIYVSLSVLGKICGYVYFDLDAAEVCSPGLGRAKQCVSCSRQ